MRNPPFLADKPRGLRLEGSGAHCPDKGGARTAPTRGVALLVVRHPPWCALLGGVAVVRHPPWGALMEEEA